MIDPDSPELAYRQAAAILRQRIDDGTYTGRIPGEVDLASDLGVARMTIRRAVKILVDEGRLTVVPGRGTFVRRE